MLFLKSVRVPNSKVLFLDKETKVLRKELGWKPKYVFDTGIKETINWYSDNKEWMDKVINKEYLDYYKKMYGDK